MSISQDFIYNFRGFHGSPSRCHIRILDEQDKPLVVICSQLANKPGTSVTNASEMIAQSMQEYLSQDNIPLTTAVQRYIQTSKLTQILGDLVKRLKECKSLTVFALESIKLALEYQELQTHRSRKVSEMLWIEHYDASIGLGNPNEYVEVSFKPQSWEPSWTSTTLEKLSKSTGYPVSDFRIPREILCEP